MSTVEEIEKKIEIAKKIMRDTDNENVRYFYKIHLELLNDDLKKARTIEAYHGRLKRAARLMKQIHDITIENYDENSFKRIKEKAMLEIKNERLHLEQKIRELEKKLMVVERFENIVFYTSPELWFSYLQDITLKEDE